jgi:DNA-binding HxlR family transcriptional regulator
VEYRMTELGESLLEPLTGLIAWAEKSQSRIATARTEFDLTDPSRG